MHTLSNPVPLWLNRQSYRSVKSMLYARIYGSSGKFNANYTSHDVGVELNSTTNLTTSLSGPSVSSVIALTFLAYICGQSYPTICWSRSSKALSYGNSIATIAVGQLRPDCPFAHSSAKCSLVGQPEPSFTLNSQRTAK